MKKRLIATNKGDEGDSSTLGSDNGGGDHEDDEHPNNSEHRDNNVWVDPTNMADFPELLSRSCKISG